MTICKVGLSGIKFNAAIGYYEQERIFKNDFLVDLWVSFPKNNHNLEDDLSKTLDYGLLHNICKNAFKKESLLIETVAQEILDQINQSFSFVKEINISIKKLNPPLQAEIAFSFVELNYKK